MSEIIISAELQRQTAIKLISGLDLSRPWKVTVVRQVNKRSLSQNALYHKWVGIIADETGGDHDEIHEAFKQMFVTPQEKFIGDAPFLYRSTTKLSTQEMTLFLERVYQFSVSTLGILLPLPEEQHIQERGA